MTNWFARRGACYILVVCCRRRASGGPHSFLEAAERAWQAGRRTGVGLAALAVFSPVGGMMGISLGVNLLNGVVLGLLGLPGFGLLLMLNWIL